MYLPDLTIPPGGYVFVAITVVLVNLSFLLCRRMVRDQQARGQGTAARRGRVLLAGLGLGSLGGADFVPALGSDVFPFGGIALMLGSICNVYARARRLRCWRPASVAGTLAAP